ncbi:MAG: HAMP domain-containing histidine kinase [Actinomycetota bacterium]|nr:HAMP domain-containing histidine kinase [Actinomycetota bacterium]
MTLRVRLLLGLVVLAAIGLTVAGGVTYREQRSFLSKRVNEQLASAVAAPQQFGARRNDNANPNAPRSVPFGTYAEVRYDDGTIRPVSADTVSTNTKPSLPATITLGQIFTVHHPSYRVLAGRVIDQQLDQPATLVVAVPLRDMSEALHRLLFVELIVALGVLLGLAVLAWWVVKLGLRPLEDMQQTAGAIAAGDLSRRVEIVDEHTEVGRLGLALNEMMQRIQTAFEARAASEARLRRFVGDASHELRTPLTSIRGYAELFRRGAADRPEDLAKAMRRIEEEANRMGSLVDDMLLLARLEQGRPLERQPVDLTRITRDAVDDARAVAPNRPIDYSPNGAIFVPGDEARLRQVLANLLQNANRHTPPDTPVHVQVVEGVDEALIEVADEGPGMQSDDTSRVFERFWRSDPSRTRASGGAGLGLAIVAAIADAHGGHAEVLSTPGLGSTFRVHLPRSVPPTPDTYAADAQSDAPPDAPTDAPSDAATIPLADLEDS